MRIVANERPPTGKWRLQMKAVFALLILLAAFNPAAPKTTGELACELNLTETSQQKPVFILACGGKTLHVKHLADIGLTTKDLTGGHRVMCTRARLSRFAQLWYLSTTRWKYTCRP